MQRKVLQLFKNYTAVKSKQIAALLNFNQRAASLLCKKWVLHGFLKIVDPSYKARTYALAEPYDELLAQGVECQLICPGCALISIFFTFLS